MLLGEYRVDCTSCERKFLLESDTFGRRAVTAVELSIHLETKHDKRAFCFMSYFYYEVDTLYLRSCAPWGTKATMHHRMIIRGWRPSTGATEPVSPWGDHDCTQ